MKMKKITNIIFILFLLGLFFSCSSSQNTTNRNVAGIYMPGINLLDPDMLAFHTNDTLTAFHFRINSANILYTKKREDSTFSANIKVTYELYEFDSKTLLDSASLNFVDFGNNKEKKFLDGVFMLNTLFGKIYTIKVTFNDLNRDQYIKKSLKLDKSSIYNAQNYLVLDENQHIIFKNYLKNNSTFYLKKNESITDTTFVLKYYKSDFPIAKPPFSSSEIPEEKMTFSPEFTEELTFDSLQQLSYEVTENGLYFVHPKGQSTGPTLFNFQDNFPEIKTAENMIPPMRYITTSKEFEQLITAENPKLEVDKFWKDVAGSNDRARTLIREYFKRVESANNYFTSYMEGWKTDRGIIYIIFGVPNVVYKHKNYENWIYGEENNMMSLSFVFHKVASPITDNDFALSRSPVFKNNWFRAVDSWRSGRIY